MSDPIEFVVLGNPEPKGSTRAFRAGTRTVTTSANPRLRGWEALVIEAASEAMGERSPLDCPIRVALVFRLARPAGHFGKRGLLPSAPDFPVGKPDLDKLVRGVLDGITQAGVWRDDSRVVAVRAMKVYGDHPGAVVTIWEAEA